MCASGVKIRIDAAGRKKVKIGASDTKLRLRSRPRLHQLEARRRCEVWEYLGNCDRVCLPPRFLAWRRRRRPAVRRSAVRRPTCLWWTERANRHSVERAGKVRAEEIMHAEKMHGEQAGEGLARAPPLVHAASVGSPPQYWRRESCGHTLRRFPSSRTGSNLASTIFRRV